MNILKLTFKVDKCHSFGVKKIYVISNSIPTESHYKWRKIPPIENRESFEYLGNNSVFQWPQM